MIYHQCGETSTCYVINHSAAVLLKGLMHESVKFRHIHPIIIFIVKVGHTVVWLVQPAGPSGISAQCRTEKRRVQHQLQRLHNH